MHTQCIHRLTHSLARLKILPASSGGTAHSGFARSRPFSCPALAPQRMADNKEIKAIEWTLRPEEFMSVIKSMENYFSESWVKLETFLKDGLDTLRATHGAGKTAPELIEQQIIELRERDLAVSKELVRPRAYRRGPLALSGRMLSLAARAVTRVEARCSRWRESCWVADQPPTGMPRRR